MKITKRLTCLLSGAVLLLNAHAQKIDIKPYYIGDRVTDLPLKPLFNYKDSVAKLSTFGHKLIILDFWGTSCSNCIAMFPLEDSLQKVFKNDLQFILITTNPYDKVKDFIKNWNNKNNTKFSLPIVTNGLAFRDLFWRHYLPHYVWLSPRGKLLAQTSDMSIDFNIIKTTIEKIKAEERRLKSHFFPEDYFHFPPMTGIQEYFFKQYQD